MEKMNSIHLETILNKVSTGISLRFRRRKMTARRSMSKAFSAIIALAFFLATVNPVPAQYYGRNKVQYRSFDFQIMKTQHFDIYFYLASEETVKLAAIMAERWYSRLSRMFNHELKGRQPLILYGSSPEFQQTTVIAEQMGEGTGGVTESFKRRVVLPYGVSLGETDHVIGHELVHAFQYDLMSQGHSDDRRMNDIGLRIPLWFIEGMAEYLSIGPYDPNTSMWMREEVKKDKLPQISKLENSYKYFPYRWGQALWAYITGRWGDEVVGKIMKTVGRSGDYQVTIEGLLGTKFKQLAADWHKAMQDAYKPVLEKTQAADKLGRIVFAGTESNAYNLSPSLSPDGREVVFLSSRDMFSIDIFLADAETGKIKKKIVSTAVDPHFESIQFIKSAGAWNASGDKFVFSGAAKGRPILTIIDMKRGKTEKEIPFPELGEILSPYWSPDGRYIVFSALTGGASDIFIYEMETNSLKQVTKDLYGDIQPVWSPDGKKIAFATERFSANLKWAESGNYEIGLFDVASGEIEKLLAFPQGKNINPQWTGDSKSLYFISDQNGKTDLYRIEVESGKIFQVTNIESGISGISDLSPAISFAQGGQRLFLSFFDRDYHSILAIDDQAVLEGQAFLAQFERNPGLLPPRVQPEGALLGLLRNPLFGLPKDTDFAIADYKPKLTLDYVTPPSLAVGVDRYGTYGAGGISAYWSDMLGYHTIVTTALTGPQIVDTSAVLAYLNLRKRFNWGVAGQRLVYPYPYYYLYEDEFGGEPAIIEVEDIYRIINNDISLFGSYPLNQVRRFELSAGFRNIGFSRTLYTRVYSLYDGSLIFNGKEKGDAPDSISYGYLTLSHYYDTGIFGATSPILGQNYGISFNQTLGQLTYSTAVVDFRKYLMPFRPVTLAFRALHYGRYGSDAEDDRLYPIYIAYWDLVRGYESFTSEEYSDGLGFDYNRLFGSKMLVANVELRFPLLKVLGIGKGYYGAWPLEFFGFYDWGIAWADEPGYWWGGTTNEDVRAWFAGGNRRPISSTGIGIRTNLFGMLILGLNYVYPISRPERGWHFQLSLSPGI